ncbi:MAG: RluA family pseudouridine synthase [Acetatifactor sp.]
MKTRIVYEDRDILICHKPAGLATQSSSVGRPDVVSELKNYLSGGYVGIVHRLDQPVEGLLVFARHPRAAAALNRQLTEGMLGKRYCALVWGRPAAEEGEWTDYLRKEGNLSRVVLQETPGARRAVLRYRVRAREDIAAGRHTCLDIRIGTGRFHQIRCQLAHRGLPILGDQKYGTAESLEESRSLGIRYAALCACEIRLTHPATGREIFYEISPDWINY